MMNKQDHDSRGKSNRPGIKARVIVISLLIAAGGVTAAVAQFGVPQIVYDPVHHGESIAGWALQAKQMLSEIAVLKEQINNQVQAFKQFGDFAKYRELIDGAWKKTWPKLPDKQTVELCRVPIQIDWVGWKVDEFKRIKQTLPAAEALDELRRVLDNRTGYGSWIKMREHLETIWGDVPVTTNGIAVEAAHREMGTTIAYAGEVYKSILEKQRNITQLKDEINVGGLAPGDLERKMTLLAAEQLDVELLMVQTMNQANRVSVHQLGFQANAAGNAELNRLRDREHRLQLMGSVYFSPARPASGEVVQ